MPLKYQSILNLPGVSNALQMGNAGVLDDGGVGRRNYDARWDLFLRAAPAAPFHHEGDPSAHLFHAQLRVRNSCAGMQKWYLGLVYTHI